LDQDSIFCPELIFDINNDKSISWRSEDWWFHVSCSDCDVQGTYDNYGNCSIIRPDWEGVHNYDCGQSPIPSLNFFEIKIPFNKINIDFNDTFGLGIRVIFNTELYTLWPNGMSMDSPATWATAVIRPKLY
jgi:hypothetical protein